MNTDEILEKIDALKGAIEAEERDHAVRMERLIDERRALVGGNGKPAKAAKPKRNGSNGHTLDNKNLPAATISEQDISHADSALYSAGNALSMTKWSEASGYDAKTLGKIAAILEKRKKITVTGERRGKRYCSVDIGKAEVLKNGAADSGSADETEPG